MDPLDQLRDELTAQFSQTIQNLTTEIQNLRIRVEAAEAKPPYEPPKPITKRPKPSLPDPDKFTGITHNFDTWNTVIRAKLAIDGAAIGDSLAQFYYVYMSLTSQVQAMVFPQIVAARESGEYNFETILDQLTRVYDNPNKVHEAEDRLLSIQQDSSDSVIAYILRFEHLLYEAKGQHWSDATKISILRKGLASSLRNRLSQQLNLPRDYIEFVKVIQQLATHTQTSNPGHDGADKMDPSFGAITASPNTDLVALEDCDPENSDDAN